MIVVFVKEGGYYFVNPKEFSAIDNETMYVIGRVEKSVDTQKYLTDQDAGFYLSLNKKESRVAI